MDTFNTDLSAEIGSWLCVFVCVTVCSYLLLKMNDNVWVWTSMTLTISLEAILGLKEKLFSFHIIVVGFLTPYVWHISVCSVFDWYVYTHVSWRYLCNTDHFGILVSLLMVHEEVKIHNATWQKMWIFKWNLSDMI